MNKKENKAKDFSWLGRPYVPPEPKKTTKIEKTIWSGEFDSYSKINFPANLTGGHLEIGSISSGDFGDSVEIKYVITEEVENENYNRELRKYKKALKEAEEWDAERKIYNEKIKIEKEKKQKSAEYKKYLELKKKYGD